MNQNQVIRLAAPVYILQGCNVISGIVAYVSGQQGTGWLVVMGTQELSTRSSQLFEGSLEEYANEIGVYTDYVEALSEAATLALELEKNEHIDLVERRA